MTSERGNDYSGWAFYTDGGSRVVDGETVAGWGVISLSPHGRIDVMFGPVVTTKAHIAFSGARTHFNNTAEMTAIIFSRTRTHSNNTAEMTAMVEALSFLGQVVYLL